MAGSYHHAVTNSGKLRNNRSMVDMIENGGDMFETVEEMFGMIWYLARGDASMVEEARQKYLDGIMMSPGRQKERS